MSTPGARSGAFATDLKADGPAALTSQHLPTVLHFAALLTGATFRVPPVQRSLDRLCRDGRRAMQIGIAQVGADKPLAGIGKAVGRFASDRGYTLIRNLASHGVGRALHEEPGEVPTWPTQDERRRINRGLVLTVEPFLSRGGLWATTGDDEWTLYSEPAAPVVQYEHTVVATDRRPIILTLPG